MWQEGCKIYFACFIKETGKECLSGGWAELKDINNNNNSNQVQSTRSASVLASDKVFAEMGQKLKERPEMAAKVGAVFQWVITKDGKQANSWGMIWGQSINLLAFSYFEI